MHFMTAGVPTLVLLLTLIVLYSTFRGCGRASAAALALSTRAEWTEPHTGVHTQVEGALGGEGALVGQQARAAGRGGPGPVEAQTPTGGPHR